MRGWLVLFAVILLFGLAALIVIDEPADAELWLPPDELPDPYRPDPGAQPTPAPDLSARSLPSAPAPLAAARAVPDDEPKPAPTVAPEPTTPAPVRIPPTATSELDELIAALRLALHTDGRAPENLVQRLRELLRESPEAAAEAIDRLFSMPRDLGRARPLLFQALLATGDDAVIAEMSRRIKQARETWLATAPRTREELHAALLFGDAKVRTRALQTLKREHLSDPLVQDYLRTTATDPTAAWGLRSVAIKALGRTRSPASSSLLLGLFSSTAEKRERAAIMRALERHMEINPAVRATMLPLAYDAGRSIAERRFALTGLARSKRDPEVRKALLHVLRTADDVHLRRIAARGLKTYADDAAVQALVGDHLRSEKDATVKSTLASFILAPVN